MVGVSGLGPGHFGRLCTKGLGTEPVAEPALPVPGQGRQNPCPVWQLGPVCSRQQQQCKSPGAVRRKLSLDLVI